ncbi:MAG: 50S ribosomal protein L10 [Microgenomates bacterium OLB23]|nr:MAG: 50S ribosomal protein L10 [Microgenomates bacterium OLB23]
MANTQKRAYVENVVSLLKDNPQFIVVGFGGTKHKKLEEFRAKLRELSADPSQKSGLMILKNSLFKVALEKYNAHAKMMKPEEISTLVDNTSGQSAVLFLSQDWVTSLKTFKSFSKEEEGMQFKVGLIDGVVYVQAGLSQLADLPSKEELVAKIIGSLYTPATKLVYGLKFNATQLVTVLKNAAEKAN